MAFGSTLVQYGQEQRNKEMVWSLDRIGHTHLRILTGKRKAREMMKKKKKKSKVKQIVSAAKITRAYGPFDRRVLQAAQVLELIEQPEPKTGKRRKPPKYKVCGELPTADEFFSMRDDYFTESLGSRVENAKGTAESLKEELEEWKDGMEGTNLENTEKYNQLEEAVDQLEAASNSLEEQEIPEVVADLPVVVLPCARKRRCPYSRPNQQADALSELSGVQDVLESFCENKMVTTEETRTEVEDYKSCIDNAVDEFEAVEFPGMFG